MTDAAESGNRSWKVAHICMLMVATLAPAAVAQTTNSAAIRAKRTVLISVRDRRLAVIEDGNIVAKFHVAVGAAKSPSPTGKFQIVSRVANPTYYHKGTVVQSGSNNPVGTRWIGLSQKGYGIHGTNAPKSVGHAASHGCIRLRNADVERLFTMLQVGDEVEIRGERDEQTAQIFSDDAEDATVAEAQGSVDGRDTSSDDGASSAVEARF